MDENSRDKEVKIRRGSSLMCQPSPPRLVLPHWPERNERSLFYERQEIYI